MVARTLAACTLLATFGGWLACSSSSEQGSSDSGTSCDFTQPCDPASPCGEGLTCAYFGPGCGPKNGICIDMARAQCFVDSAVLFFHCLCDGGVGDGGIFTDPWTDDSACLRAD